MSPGIALVQATLCWIRTQLPSPKGGIAPNFRSIFGRQFVKRFSLCYHTVVCLSVSCLSVTLVYCGQTVGRIKMKLVMQVLGRPRPWPHCVRWGPSYPSPKGEQPPMSIVATVGHVRYCRTWPMHFHMYNGSPKNKIVQFLDWLYIGHGHGYKIKRSWPCVSVCPSPHTHTTARTWM